MKCFTSGNEVQLREFWFIFNLFCINVAISFRIVYIQSYCFWKRIYLNLSSESELWFHSMWNAWIMVQAYAIIFSFKITIRVSFSIWILGICSLNGCRGLVHCTIVRLCIWINNMHTLFIRTHARSMQSMANRYSSIWWWWFVGCLSIALLCW